MKDKQRVVAEVAVAGAIMKKATKLKLVILICLHLYFYSFFFWYRPQHSSVRFVDSYKPMPSSGPTEATVFMPFGNTEKPAGTITRTICYLYTPLSHWWEKQGVGVFCVDDSALVKLFDKKELGNEEQ